jgi:hypothetical protein
VIVESLRPWLLRRLYYLPRPLTDSAADDTQATRYLGYGGVAFTKKAPIFYQSFFNLLRV